MFESLPITKDRKVAVFAIGVMLAVMIVVPFAGIAIAALTYFVVKYRWYHQGALLTSAVLSIGLAVYGIWVLATTPGNPGVVAVVAVALAALMMLCCAVLAYYFYARTGKE